MQNYNIVSVVSVTQDDRAGRFHQTGIVITAMLKRLMAFGSVMAIAVTGGN